MHREKWTLFEEATRVPLLIYHPASPYKGRHYTHPVELVDLYPTLLDLAGEEPLDALSCPGAGQSPDKERQCYELEGQSLAPVVLGMGVSRGLGRGLGRGLEELGTGAGGNN
jgi:arylsulfatase A-like enzyme